MLSQAKNGISTLELGCKLGVNCALLLKHKLMQARLERDQRRRLAGIVGQSHDTPFFAVHCLNHWWRSANRSRYPHATQLNVLGDCGGSNGCRLRTWK